MSARAEAPPQPTRAPDGEKLAHEGQLLTQTSRTQTLHSIQSSKVVLTHEFLELFLQSVVTIAPTGTKSHTKPLV